MTSTRHIPARFLSATAALTGLALLTVGCGSSSPKAKATGTPATTTTATAASDPNDSPFCQTARKWMVHELDGGGDSVIEDPVAFKKYWGEYMDYIATATRQSPAEIRADWPAGYGYLVKQFTPVLAKYGYDIARAKAEGTPAELAIGKRVDDGPNAAEQRAQDAVHEYADRVCQTGQPPAADVSFDGVTPNPAYCDAAKASDELAGKVNEAKWSIAAVRDFVTGKEFAALGGQAKQHAPAEIKADVVADVDWQLNQQVDVLEKFGFDVRKLFLQGTAEDRAIFQRSDPAVADHYARTAAYEEQVCGV